jgi:PEP-CTERM motif
MKSTQLMKVILMSVVLVVGGYSLEAEASSILAITDSAGGSATCDNALVFSATNCGAGFATMSGGNTILFTGVVGGFTIGNISLTGNQPGNAVAGNVLVSEFNVLHVSGTGNLQIDFGVNNFMLPVGPGLFLSASDTGNWGQSQSTDMKAFIAWGKADNTLTIPGAGPGGATAIAPNCVPGAGLTTSCSVATLDVPFTRTGNYSLTGRQTITQSTQDTLGASYTATVAANAQPTTVPEPASLILLGTGMVLLATFRRKVK